MNNAITQAYTWRTHSLPSCWGVSISATANFYARQFSSLDLTITDYTCDPNGVSSTLTIYTKGDWTSIPVPASDASPPVPDPQFTVRGTYPQTPGSIRLCPTPGGLYLDIRFSYGPEHQRTYTQGFIIKIDTLCPERGPATLPQDGI